MKRFVQWLVIALCALPLLIVFSIGFIVSELSDN